MSLPDRRQVLFSLGALVVSGGLAACGFTPVYGPQGGGGKLLNAVALSEPENRADYDFRSRFEERLGRGLIFRQYQFCLSCI